MTFVLVIVIVTVIVIVIEKRDDDDDEHEHEMDSYPCDWSEANGLQERPTLLQMDKG